MRRLTDEEMADLTGLARIGRVGPGRALDGLWDLILRYTEGITLAEAGAAGRNWLVQNYAIAEDQSAQIYESMVLGRRLPAGAVRRIGLTWLMWSPATFDEDEPQREA
jgi:hypothetical protein